MTRLSRAVALTAVTLALGAMACKKEETKADAPEAKTGDSPAAEPTQPSAGDPGAAAAKPTAPPPGAAAPGQPPGMPAMPAQPAKKPDSVKDSHVAVADNIVAAANKFGEDLQATKGDCKKATGVLKTGGGPLKQMMSETDKLQQELKGDQAAMMWFQQTYGPKMMTALQKVGAVLQQCSSDKEFAAAFESLGLGRPRQPPPAAVTGKGAGHGALPTDTMTAPPAKAKKEAEKK